MVDFASVKRVYTSVFRAGNYLYIREVRDGKRRKFKIEYKPTLYIPTTKQSTLHAPDGTAVEATNPGTMQDCYQFLQKYKGVDNFRIYGNTAYEYAYINETYPTHIEHKSSEIVICNLDIEVESKHGFSEAKDALNEVQAITIKNSVDGIFHVFACQPFDDDAYNEEHKDTVIVYHQCADELELFDKFLDLWETLEPDIVTGWNCLPTSATVWKQHEIGSISTTHQDDELFDSKCVRRFPTSKKQPYTALLYNGGTITSSKDHIFPIATKPKGSYSNLISNHKSIADFQDATLEDIISLQKTHDVYFQYTLRNNDNSDYCINGSPVDPELFYALGMLYTDGTAVLENRPRFGVCVTGAAFYNTNRAILERIKKCVDVFSIRRHPENPEAGFSLDERGVGTWRLKTSFGVNNPFSALYSFVMQHDGKKKLSLHNLSKLSACQFAAFLAGAIDGDGSIDNLAFTMVDYTQTGPEIWQELLAWNGVFSYRNTAHIRMSFDSRNVLLHSLPLSHPHKRSLLYEMPFERVHASNQNLAIAQCEGGYWLRLEEVVVGDHEVEMADIETTTHYFRSGGIKTHNCRMYDIPYLINRISRIMTPDDAKRLSPWGTIRESTVNIFNNAEVVYDVAGISVLDYLLIYRKNVLEPRESYRLDYIAEVELKERKLDYSEHGSLQALYENDFKKFIEYNIHDVRLVDRIEAKRKLIELQLIVAYHAHVNYVDVLSQVRTWDTLICNHLLAQGVVVPQKTDRDKDAQFTGAYVMKPTQGMFEWVASFDVQSLYPTIMRTLNMGMETKLTRREMTAEMRNYQNFINSNLMVADDEGKLNVNPDVITQAINDELIEHFKNEDVAIAANGVFYKRGTKSFYSVMIEELFNNRLEHRKKAKDASKMIEAIKNELKNRKN
jgi:DNA polymerase elongation subunit (family B)